MSDYTPIVTPYVHDLTEPVLIGTILNSTLFGVLAVQIYLYYVGYTKDRWQLKALVYGLFVWILVQKILLVQFAFNLLGSGWGDPRKLTVGVTWFSGPIMDGIASVAVLCAILLAFDQVWFSYIPMVNLGTMYANSLMVLFNSRRRSTVNDHVHAAYGWDDELNIDAVSAPIEFSDRIAEDGTRSRVQVLVPAQPLPSTTVEISVEVCQEMHLGVSFANSIDASRVLDLKAEHNV
ncbi:hypothetical protein EW146_g4056 [Bondarzewia mesenterica]|uniref:Uncharacterized protein n=1 Tax=Bondarzewia mesenterica TaxID=1095465 RepID=A0A4S4LW66_9AGAM|nr:hypothetical protein EW146_g4056 [Bondarzewia mesenterica]